MLFAFTGEAFSGNPGALQDAWQLIVSGAFIPTIGVIHLWFLYFLAMFAVLAWALGMLFRKSTAFTNSVNSACRFYYKGRCYASPFLLSLIFLPGLDGAARYIYQPFVESRSGHIFCVLPVFGCGWMIYKTNSLSYLAGGTWWQLVLATVLFFGTNVPVAQGAWVLTVQQLSTAVSGTLFIFGFLALFLRYFNHYAPRLSYLMDAAYWVYIIHLPIAGLLPGIMAAWPISVFAKFGISFTLTTILSLASYHYLVRGSFIGMFLNGKVHPRKKLLKIEVATA